MASSLICIFLRAASSTESMSESALEHVLRRDRAIIIAALTAITVLAWSYIVWLANIMDMGGLPMSGMPDMGAMLAPAFKPWTVTDFVVMFVMWTVMMIGMMTPSVAPIILIYARVGRQAERQDKPLAATSFFAGGYLLAWTATSLFATIGQWLMERAALLTPMMTTTSGIAGGLILMAVGVYQWTPAKSACLKHCRAPLSFIQQRGGFRRDSLGSLTVGFHHGLFCIGCCWALMALLFVGGIMNIVWIAGLTTFVLLEKVAPLGRVITRGAGAGLIVSGAWLLFSTLQ